MQEIKYGPLRWCVECLAMLKPITLFDTYSKQTHDEDENNQQNTATDRPQRLHGRPSPSFQTLQIHNCNTRSQTARDFQLTIN